MGNYIGTKKNIYVAKLAFHGSEHVFNNLKFKKVQKFTKSELHSSKLSIDIARKVDFLKVENPLIVGWNDELEMLEEDTGICGEEDTGIYKIYKMRNKTTGDVGIIPSIIVASEGLQRKR